MTSSVGFVQPEGKSLNQIQFCMVSLKAGNLHGSGGTGYGSTEWNHFEDCFFGLAVGEQGAWDVGGIRRILESVWIG